MQNLILIREWYSNSVRRVVSTNTNALESEHDFACTCKGVHRCLIMIPVKMTHDSVYHLHTAVMNTHTEILVSVCSK